MKCWVCKKDTEYGRSFNTETIEVTVYSCEEHKDTKPEYIKFHEVK